MSGRTYAVVYQMGKVASTSLVAALDDHSDITAVQAHFLGLDALREILPSVVGSGLGAYFHAHQYGQFKANIEVTRRINLILDGQVEERLLILSLARAPVDWFRSSLVQDMTAYAPQLVDYALRNGLAGDDDAAMVSAALRDCLGHFAEILKARGGIDAHFNKLRQGQGQEFAGTPLEQDAAMQQIFRMMLRPYRWFEDHFERAMQLDLSVFETREGVYLHRGDRADYVILRYEDIARSFGPAMEAIGLTVPLRMERKNTSAAKPFAEATRLAFESDEAAALTALARQSGYAMRFSY